MSNYEQIVALINALENHEQTQTETYGIIDRWFFHKKNCARITFSDEDASKNWIAFNSGFEELNAELGLLDRKKGERSTQGKVNGVCTFTIFTQDPDAKIAELIDTLKNYNSKNQSAKET